MSCALRYEVALPSELGDPRTNRSRSKSVQCATPLECLTASGAGNVRPGCSFLPTRRRFGEALVTLILGPGWPHTGRGCLAPRASRGGNASPTPAPRAGSKLASFSTRQGPPRSMRMMMVVGASWSMSSGPHPAEPPSSKTGLRQPETNPRGSIDSWPRAESFRRGAVRIPERDRRRCGSTRRYRCRSEHPAARVRWTGIAEQPAKAGQRHPPYGLDGRNRAADAAPVRFRVPFRPHGWSVDVPAGPGPADRGRGIRPRERLDRVHAGTRWPCPRHLRPSRGRRGALGARAPRPPGSERAAEPRRARDRPSRIRHRSSDSPGALQRLRGRLERRPADGGHEVAVIARSEGLGPRADRRGPDR